MSRAQPRPAGRCVREGGHSHAPSCIRTPSLSRRPPGKKPSHSLAEHGKECLAKALSPPLRSWSVSHLQVGSNPNVGTKQFESSTQLHATEAMALAAGFNEQVKAQLPKADARPNLKRLRSCRAEAQDKALPKSYLSDAVHTLNHSASNRTETSRLLTTTAQSAR